jgi:hypothetical protein
VGVSLIGGICVCSAVFVEVVGQTNTGSERLVEYGIFVKGVQRLGSDEFLDGGGGVHDLNSPLKEVSGEGVIM